MGLGDIVDTGDGEEQETTTERDDARANTIQEDPQVVAERIRDKLFLSEFCEDLDMIIEPPEEKEHVSRGSEELEKPLPEGYVDCTDRVEYMLSDTKFLDCPHCPDDVIRQRRGGGCRRSDTWTRCRGCSRILVDLETDNRNEDGEIVNQSGIDSWM